MTVKNDNLTLLRVKRTRLTDGHLLRLSCGEMGEGHVSELCCAVLDPTVDSMHAGGPSVLTEWQLTQVEKICMLPRQL